MLRVKATITAPSSTLCYEALVLFAGHLRESMIENVGAGEGRVSGLATEENLQNAKGALSDAWGPAVTVQIETWPVESNPHAGPATDMPIVFGGEPVAEVPAPASTDADHTVPFRVRLSGLDAAELAEAGHALARKLVGHATFGEPPVRSEAGAFCVLGTCASLDVVARLAEGSPADVLVDNG